MALTYEQIALLRWSHDKLTARVQPASVYFYEALFREGPELRGLFRDDLAGQGMKFMTTLGMLIAALETPGAMKAEISELGDLHRRLGITPAMFVPMEEALIATLRHVLDDDLPADVETAWRLAYAALSEAMMEHSAA